MKKILSFIIAFMLFFAPCSYALEQSGAGSSSVSVSADSAVKKTAAKKKKKKSSKKKKKKKSKSKKKKTVKSKSKSSKKKKSKTKKTKSTKPKKASVTKTAGPTMTERINTIGNRLLTRNKIEAAINFKLRKTSKINAYADLHGNVMVFSGLIRICENDEELAGIIAHEVGHIVNAHMAKLTLANMAVNVSLELAKAVPVVALPVALVYLVSAKRWQRMDEYEADITSVDLMIGAGYNPLAMVSALQKINSGKYLDFLSTHPSGEKRTLYIYDYIAHRYPQYIEKGYDTESYREFLAYAKPILDERKFDNDLMTKHLEKQEKLEIKRKKKYAKYQRAYYEKQERIAQDKIEQEQKALEAKEKLAQKALKEEQKAAAKQKRLEEKKIKKEQKLQEKLEKQKQKALIKEQKQEEKRLKKENKLKEKDLENKQKSAA